MKPGGLAAVLGIWLVLLAGGCGEKQELIGEKLSGLEFERLDGGREALSAYGGKVVLLNVWATWCAPCRAEMPALQKLSDALDPARAVVLGVSVDRDPNLVREYLREQGFSFPRHFDRSGSLAREVLKVRGYPETYVLDPGGVVRWRHVGIKDWAEPGMDAWLYAFAKKG
jgi:thiol-disulfide isomerase/thioredoxin